MNINQRDWMIDENLVEKVEWNVPSNFLRRKVVIDDFGSLVVSGKVQLTREDIFSFFDPAFLGERVLSATKNDGMRLSGRTVIPPWHSVQESKNLDDSFCEENRDNHCKNVASLILSQAVLCIDDIDTWGMSIEVYMHQSSVLNGLNLSGVHLGDSQFRNCSLVLSCFNDSTFIDGELVHVYARKSSFIRAGFESSRLYDSDFCYSNFTRAWFKGSDLDNSDFRHCNFTGAYFVGASMRNVYLSSILAEDANFKSVVLSRSVCDEANFIGSSFDFSDLSWVDLSRSLLRNCSFNFADLSDACFADVQLHGTDLSTAIVNKTDFSGADLGMNCRFDLLERGAIFDDDDFGSTVGIKSRFDDDFPGLSVEGSSECLCERCREYYEDDKLVEVPDIITLEDSNPWVSPEEEWKRFLEEEERWDEELERRRREKRRGRIFRPEQETLPVFDFQATRTSFSFNGVRNDVLLSLTS